MRINNDNLKNHFRQQKFKQSAIEWNTFDPQPGEFGLGKLRSAPKRVHKVLDKLLILSFKYNRLYPSQIGYLMESTGIKSRRTMYLAIEWLRENGYIKTLFSYNKPLEYKISTWFNNPFIRESLKDRLSVFRNSLSLLLLLASVQGLKKSKHDVLNDFNIIKNNTTRTYEESDIYFKDVVKKKNTKKKKVEESMKFLDKLQQELNLGEYELAELGKYHELVVKEAYRVFKTKSAIENPFRFIVVVCNGLVERNPRYKIPNAAINEVKEISKNNPCNTPQKYGSLTGNSNNPQSSLNNPPVSLHNMHSVERTRSILEKTEYTAWEKDDNETLAKKMQETINALGNLEQNKTVLFGEFKVFAKKALLTRLDDINQELKKRSF